MEVYEIKVDEADKPNAVFDLFQSWVITGAAGNCQRTLQSTLPLPPTPADMPSPAPSPPPVPELAPALEVAVSDRLSP
tara:strand:- start:430 stop:663 length:234 start_codon:yes stop_codon:yes gene_type:complete